MNKSIVVFLNALLHFFGQIGALDMIDQVVVQQTVALDVEHPESVVAVGLDEPNTIAYINQTYQFSDGRYLIQSDGDNTIGVFNIQRDRQLNDNLVDRIQCEDLARIMKKMIQEYNNRFINNQLYIDKEALHEQATDTLYLEPCGGEIGQE